MLEVYEAIDALADRLLGEGIELPDALKRRDPKEPNRSQKHLFEDRIYKLTLRRFAAQKRQIKEALDRILPGRKQFENASDYMSMMPDHAYMDEKTEAALLRVFIEAAEDGVGMFALDSTIAVDWTAINTKASDWARRYVTGIGLPDEILGWFEGLDNTTKTRLAKELQNFVDVPGYTIGDIMKGLGLTGPQAEMRALRIATTEVTRIYSEADQLAGMALAGEFPDVKVVKTWWTNADDRVCPICLPMNGITIPADEQFQTIAGEMDGPPGHIFCRCWRSSTTDILGDK